MKIGKLFKKSRKSYFHLFKPKNMFCKKCLFLFKDVVCPAGKSNSQVAVEAGDTIGDQ